MAAHRSLLELLRTWRTAGTISSPGGLCRRVACAEYAASWLLVIILPLRVLVVQCPGFVLRWKPEKPWNRRDILVRWLRLWASQQQPAGHWEHCRADRIRLRGGVVDLAMERKSILRSKILQFVSSPFCGPQPCPNFLSLL